MGDGRPKSEKILKVCKAVVIEKVLNLIHAKRMKELIVNSTKKSLANTSGIDEVGEFHNNGSHLLGIEFPGQMDAQQRAICCKRTEEVLSGQKISQKLKAEITAEINVKIKEK